MKVFVTGIVPDAPHEETKPALLRGVRLALARMGKMAEAKDTAYAEAVLDGAYNGRLPQLIANTEHEYTARVALRILADAGWAVGSDPALPPEPEEEFQEPLEDESAQEDESAEESERANDPDHIHDLIAHVVLAAVNGNAGQSVILANTVRYLLRREGEEEHAEFWDGVLQSLFDAFPVNEEQGQSTQTLARQFGR